MRRVTKVLAIILALITLASVVAIPVSAEYNYPMAVTIYYKNEAGNQIAPTLSTTINAAATTKPTWTSPTVSGYALKNDSDAVVTYSMLNCSFPASNYVRNGTGTYTVIYVPTYTHTVYFINVLTGAQTSAPIIQSGKPGTPYSATAPTITGFTPSKTSVSGTIGSSNTSETITYYPVTYTVSYNANGGGGAPSAQTKKHGFDLTLTTETPVRLGYDFQGWAINSTATTPVYFPGGTYSANTSTTLYAVWSAQEYTVSFDANGGTGAPASVTKVHGINLKLPQKEPTRSGYTFLGWSASSTATSATYGPGAMYTANMSRTLYAVWEKIPDVYTVTYYANGGIGAPLSQTKTEDVPLTLSSTKPTRQGYVFMGWATSSSSTTVSYYPGGTYTENAPLSLFGVWFPVPYTISYDANGGSGVPASQTKIHGQTLMLSSTRPTRSGYTFLGWSTSSSAAYASYSAGSAFTLNGDYTLYAVWSRNPETYVVYYNANGGSGAPGAQYKTEGVDLTLSSIVPTRSGYNFLGWGTSSTASGYSYAPGGIYSDDATITLYAVWLPKSYSVKYDANGGSGAPGTQIKTHDVALTLSSTIPSKSGYRFLGWNISSTAVSAIYVAGGTYSREGDTTLYAVWEKIPEQYMITYNANGGVGAPGFQIKTENVALTLSSVEPTREGYNFLGWATSSNATGASYVPGDLYTMNSGVTFYAVWFAKTYTVRYDANGGTGAPSAQSKTQDVILTLRSETPTRDKYKFLGWSTDSTATAPTYYAGGAYDHEGDTTLYAVWEFINYDFSVSGLEITPNDAKQYETVHVYFRLDSWDQKNAYRDIPVQVILNGTVVYSTTVDFSVYGVNYVNFDLNVGALEGTQTMTAWVNQDDYMNETRTGNNTVSKIFNVKKVVELTTSYVAPNADYVSGNEVVTSFYVKNSSASPVLPSDNMNFTFEVYVLNGSDELVVHSDIWEQVVIPGNATNLVYFKWTVPADSAGTLYWCRGFVNENQAVAEDDISNNRTEFNKYAVAREESQTPNTRYEETAPADYISNVTAPTIQYGRATWNMWVYENGSFILKNYGIQISSGNPVIAPSSACTTATNNGDGWTMKSGYGIELLFNPQMGSIPGYVVPQSDAYTGIQNMFATFPEYRYRTLEGYYRTLQDVSGVYRFYENGDATDRYNENARLHFIPIYLKNGNYVVSVTATQVWTPAGMITAVRNSNAIMIDGTIYDDFYVGG